MNGALSEFLRALGYNVVRHVGGVHGPDGATGAEMTNHLVLTVHDLPDETNPGGGWYVDVGLGDVLHEPLPLVPGAYDQGPFHLVLDETPAAVGDWHLTHDPAGSFTGMSWRSAPAQIDAFAERHVWLSTSPESGFVKLLAVQRRDATGVDILRGLSLTRIGDEARASTLTTSTELTDALGDLFALDIGKISNDARPRCGKGCTRRTRHGKRTDGPSRSCASRRSPTRGETYAMRARDREDPRLTRGRETRAVQSIGARRRSGPSKQLSRASSVGEAAAPTDLMRAFARDPLDPDGASKARREALRRCCTACRPCARARSTGRRRSLATQLDVDCCLQLLVALPQEPRRVALLGDVATEQLAGRDVDRVVLEEVVEDVGLVAAVERCSFNASIFSRSERSDVTSAIRLSMSSSSLGRTS